MHWIELDETWWIDIDKAYSVVIWKNAGIIHLRFTDSKENIVVIERSKWKEDFDRIFNEIIEVVQTRNNKENRRMLRIGKET